MTLATRKQIGAPEWTMARFATLALAGAIVAGCGGSAEAEDPAAGDSTTYSRVINVETHTVRVEEFTENIRLTGTVEAIRDVSVSAEEAGVIRELLVEKGQYVEEGRPLARIDDSILGSQVQEARARSELARETWARRKRLYEVDNIGSELVYLEARYLAEQAAANLAVLEERLARTVITAPIEGILDDRFVEVGVMVSPGTPVARIVDLNPVKIVAGVPERYAADVAVGSRATVTFDVIEGQAFESRIAYVGSAVNARNRTFTVEFTLANPRSLIKPQMVANLAVVRRVLDGAVVVPQEALVRVEHGYVAFVAVGGSGDARAEARAVSLGPTQRNLVVVTAGLEVGDELIVVGQNLVVNGDRIRVVGGG
ncbi:MAG TPA: efflux RND transporter periplasmic adaptor subunit [Longimicrobiales bacterium]|jgi:RND family efflux transporter MFP subunit